MRKSRNPHDRLQELATVDVSRIAAEQLRTRESKAAPAAEGEAERGAAPKKRASRTGRGNRESPGTRSTERRAQPGQTATTIASPQPRLQIANSTSADSTVPQREAAAHAPADAARFNARLSVTGPKITAAASATSAKPVTAASLSPTQTGVGPTAGVRGASERLMRRLGDLAAPARRQVQQQAVTSAALRGLGAAIKAGKGEATIRLAPEALGQLRIDVSIHDGKAEVLLKAEGTLAHELLTGSLTTLRNALEARGLIVHRLEVEPPPTASQPTEGHASTGPGTGSPGESPGTAQNQSGEPGPRSGRDQPGFNQAGGAGQAGTDAPSDDALYLASASSVARGAVRLTSGALDWLA